MALRADRKCLHEYTCICMCVNKLPFQPRPLLLVQWLEEHTAGWRFECVHVCGCVHVCACVCLHRCKFVCVCVFGGGQQQEEKRN